MNKIKIIEFITSLGEGGAQSLVKDYALMLNKELFDVSIFCIFPVLESGPGQLVRKANIKVASVYPSHNKFYSLINKLFGSYIVPWRLKMHLQSERIDCIHAHLAVLKYLPKIKMHLPSNIIYTCHSEPLRNFKSTHSSEFKAASFLSANCNLRFVALHKKMQVELNKLFNVTDTEVVYNGIDVKRFQSVSESKSDIKSSLGIRETDFVIGHVGRFTYAKNHVFIVDLFNEVLKQKPNAILVLVGTGELKLKIVNKIHQLNLTSRVLFLDQRSDIDRLLKSMDVFIFPSLYEGLPVSLIEAQASGLKCIASTNITSEAFLTPSCYALELDEPITKWVHYVLCNSLDPSPYNIDINTFEMKEDIKVLESLYSLKK